MAVRLVKPVKQVAAPPTSYRFGVKPSAVAAMEANDIPLAMGTLTEQQQLFVEHYLVDLSTRNAAEKAGYTGKNIQRIGYQLTKHPVIAWIIEKRKQERRAEMSLTADYVLNTIINTIARCQAMPKPDNNAILRGAELLARHLGMLRDRQEISGPDGGPIETKETAEAAESFIYAIDNLAKRAE